MSLMKPAALFVCVALAGCAGKTDSTAGTQKEAGTKPGVAAQAVPADKLKPEAMPPVAAAGSAKTAAVAVEKKDAQPEKKSSWWSFGGKDKEKAEPAQAAPAKTAVAKVSPVWLDDQEKLLRAAVAGSKFEVERRGDVLVVVAPADASFNPDRPHMLLPVTLGPLSRVAKLVGGDPHNAVLVLGHADSSGDAALNRKLSLERAQAVASIFRMSGLKGDRMVLRGVGSEKPRATNDSVSGRAQNRRVEMLLTRRDSLSALVAQSGD